MRGARDNATMWNRRGPSCNREGGFSITDSSQEG